eukprot:scaffold8583_cov119-Isochrysis_galbana.AAC.4
MDAATIAAGRPIGAGASCATQKKRCCGDGFGGWWLPSLLPPRRSDSALGVRGLDGRKWHHVIHLQKGRKRACGWGAGGRRRERAGVKWGGGVRVATTAALPVVDVTRANYRCLHARTRPPIGLRMSCYTHRALPRPEPPMRPQLDGALTARAASALTTALTRAAASASSSLSAPPHTIGSHRRNAGSLAISTLNPGCRTMAPDPPATPDSPPTNPLPATASTSLAA